MDQPTDLPTYEPTRRGSSVSVSRNISLFTIRSQIGGFRQVPSSGSVTAQPRPLVTDDHVFIRVPSPATGEIVRLKDNHERKGKIVFIVKNMKKNFGVRKQLL